MAGLISAPRRYRLWGRIERLDGAYRAIAAAVLADGRRGPEVGDMRAATYSSNRAARIALSTMVYDIAGVIMARGDRIFRFDVPV